MHTTLYIDHDEEITSVADRLRKTTTTEVVLVVPQRAIILQSSVNLRLLRREADKVSKQIMLVTQDELGTKFAQKANIYSQSSMEGISGVDEIKEQFVPSIYSSNDEKINEINGSSVASQTRGYMDIDPATHFRGDVVEKKSSKNFRSVEAVRSTRHESQILKQLGQKTIHIPITDVRNTSPSKIVDKSKDEYLGIASLRPKIELRNAWPESRISNDSFDVSEPNRLKRAIESDYEDASVKSSIILNSNVARFENDRDRNIQQLFSPLPSSAVQQRSGKISIASRNANKDISVSSRIRITLLAVGVLCFIVAGGSMAYLFLPHTEIVVWPKINEHSITIEISGDESVSSLNSSAKIIPIRIVERERTEKIGVPATGSASNLDQKSKGVVTISNEFSAESQILVATTRILSSNNKLFRLAETVTVPGYTKENGSIKAGSVQTKVIADGSGSEYNIGPTIFSIPGFQGTPKFTKFKVESVKSMVGGGLRGDGVPIVSEGDIESAKSKVEKDASQQIIQEITGSLSESMTIVSGATQIETKSWTAVPDVGMAATSFDYQGTIKVAVVIYSKEDVRQLILDTIKKNNILVENQEDIRIELSDSDVAIDFGSKKASWRAQAKVVIKSAIKLDILKSELLGKDQEQIRLALDRFSSIGSMDIEFLPKNLPFPARVSRFPQRVNIQLGILNDGG